MAALSAIFLLAAAQAAAPPPVVANWRARSGAEASAQATVRIVSGAWVKLGRSADDGPYHLTKATVRIEDGSRRPAELVEFQ